MACNELRTCDFLKTVRSIARYTADIIRTNYCERDGHGCAMDFEHAVLAIDQEGEKYTREVQGLKLFEKVLSEDYKETRLASASNPNLKL